MRQVYRHRALVLLSCGLLALATGCKSDRTVAPDGGEEQALSGGQGYSTITLAMPRGLGGDATQTDFTGTDHLTEVHTLSMHASMNGEEQNRRFTLSTPVPTEVLQGDPFGFWKVGSQDSRDLYRTGVFQVRPSESVQMVLGINVPYGFDLPFDAEAVTDDIYGLAYDRSNGVMKVGQPILNRQIFAGVTKEQAAGNYASQEEQEANNQFSAELEPPVAAVMVQFDHDRLTGRTEIKVGGKDVGGYLAVNAYLHGKTVNHWEKDQYGVKSTTGLYVRIQGDRRCNQTTHEGGLLFSYQPFFTVNNGSKQTYLYNTKAGNRKMGDNGRYEGFKSWNHSWGTSGFEQYATYSSVKDHLVRVGAAVELDRLEEQLKPETSVVSSTLGVRFLKPFPQPSYNKGDDKGTVSSIPYSARLVSAPDFNNRGSEGYNGYGLIFENSIDRESVASETETALYYRMPYVKLYCQVLSDGVATRFVDFVEQPEVEFVPKSGTGQWYMLNKEGEPYPLTYAEMCQLSGLIDVWTDLNNQEGVSVPHMQDQNFHLKRSYAPLSADEAAKVPTDERYASYRKAGYGNPSTKQGDPSLGSVAEGYVIAINRTTQQPYSWDQLRKVEDLEVPLNDGTASNVMPRVIFVGAEDGRAYLDILAAQTVTPGQKVYTFHARCLYRLFVNPTYSTDGKLLTDEVRRNNIYNLNITDVLRIGLPYDPADPDDPYLPKIDYPWEAELPIGPASASIRYSVTSWQQVKVDKPW